MQSPSAMLHKAQQRARSSSLQRKWFPTVFETYTTADLRESVYTSQNCLRQALKFAGDRFKSFYMEADSRNLSAISLFEGMQNGKTRLQKSDQCGFLNWGELRKEALFLPRTKNTAGSQREAAFNYSRMSSLWCAIRKVISYCTCWETNEKMSLTLHSVFSKYIKAEVVLINNTQENLYSHLSWRYNLCFRVSN